MRKRLVAGATALAVSTTLLAMAAPLAADEADEPLAPSSEFLELTNVPNVSVIAPNGNSLGRVNVAQPALTPGWPIGGSVGMNAISHFVLRHEGGSPVTVTGWELEGPHVDDFRLSVSIALGPVGSPPCELRTGGQPESRLDPCRSNELQFRVGFKPGATGTRNATLRITTNAGEIVRNISGVGVDGPIHYRVNSGGNIVTPGQEPSFGEDLLRNRTPYLVGANQATEPTTGPLAVAISDPSVPAGTPALIFGHWRRATGVPLEYAFPTAQQGTHVVRLYFAELSGSVGPGERRFHVNIEGSRVLSSFDIRASAGGANPRGITRAFRVDADGVLDVRLTPVQGSPVISGIEVRKVGDGSSIAGSVAGSDFGPVALGGTVNRTVTLRNSGSPTDPAFRVDGLAVTGPGAADYTHNLAGPVWIPPGGTHQVTLTFSPSQTGNRSVTLAASVWGAPALTRQFQAQGVTAAGSLSTPASVAFGSVRVGAETTQSVSLSNPSGATVFVGGADVLGSSSFSLVGDPFPLTVPAGASRDLEVRFAPGSSGAASATLRIEHTGTNRPSEVALTGEGLRRFVDTAGSVFEADIEWMAESGITRGCNPPTNDRFCPGDFVTRGQMAAFFVRALDLTDDGGGDLFRDDDGSVFERDIDRMAAAGITRGCNPPTNDRFCPGDFVTRGQMAAFFNRAAGLLGLGG